MRGLALVVMLTGCQQLFELHRIPEPPPTDGGCQPGIGHDEDGDCIPDAMDNCPGIANADQRDGDGDKIGDTCDPDPTVLGNRALAFVPFDDVSEAGHWTPIGAWGVGGDDYTNTDMTVGREDWTYRTPDLFGPNSELEARVTVGTLDAENDVKIGVAFYTSGSTSVEWSCSLLRTPGSNPKADAYASTSPSYSSELSPPTSFGENATYTLRMRFDATHVACSITGDAGDRAQASAPVMTTALPGYLALFTSAAAAHIHYMAVYSTTM